MNEESFRISLNKKWKGKYCVSWCSLCDCAIITCPVCRNTTCNCGSCPDCSKDFDEFHQRFKTRPCNYMTDTETKAYAKGHRLKRFIVESICEDRDRVDFQELNRKGRLSKNDQEMFL